MPNVYWAICPTGKGGPDLPPPSEISGFPCRFVAYRSPAGSSGKPIAGLGLSAPLPAAGDYEPFQEKNPDLCADWGRLVAVLGLFVAFGPPASMPSPRVRSFAAAATSCSRNTRPGFTPGRTGTSSASIATCPTITWPTTCSGSPWKASRIPWPFTPASSRNHPHLRSWRHGGRGQLPPLPCRTFGPDQRKPSVLGLPSPHVAQTHRDHSDPDPLILRMEKAYETESFSW